MLSRLLAITLLGLVTVQAQPKPPVVLVAEARLEPFADRVEALDILATMHAEQARALLV